MGYFLQNRGYPNYPSPADPSPGTDSYFSGGYITRKYGSRYGGDIDSVQVESGSPQRQNSELAGYAKELAAAIKEFMDEHY